MPRRANTSRRSERTIVEAAQASAEPARQHAAGNLSDLDLSSHQGMYAEAKLDLACAEVDLGRRPSRL